MSSGKEFKAAEETYSSFIGWLKWGTIISAVIAAFVVFLIS